MGLERVDSICRRLMDEGRSADTPAAVVAAGTLPQQRSVFASLSVLSDSVLEAGLRSPAIIVVGEVAAFPQMVASSELVSLAEAV
jgi:siroheme synthase